MSTHPKLIEVVIKQTPRAMIAMLIVSSAYFWIFSRFVPLSMLTTWFFFQILLATYRFYNTKMFEKYLEEKNEIMLQKEKKHFLISNVFQAFMWTLSSIFALVYAPQPFELVSFVMIIGIITAAALSMSTLYIAYLAFFFSMIIPQIIILLYHGEHHHIGLVVLTIIYIPATILLSKALYASRLSSIKAHDDLEKNVKELHHLSITDNLTNIYNRRYFFETSQNIVSIAKRENKPVSLLMIDIDYFKKINDTYGHHIGDFVLINLSKEIDFLLRESDIFARIGGEEFSILLHDTSIDGAKIIAEKIRTTIENKIFTNKNIKINLTISIGISELNSQNDSIEELYTKADKNLYLAKDKGRNQVIY